MASADTPMIASTPDQVAGEAKKRRGRKRTVGATRVRQINAKARERQEAWAEGGKPNLTARLTGDLGVLFRDLRKDRQEAYATGEATEGSPFKGHTRSER